MLIPWVKSHFKDVAARALRKKSMEDAQSLETPLKRCLSLWHLVFYGVAHMSGAGIYVLSGTVIRNYAGPAASLSFLTGSIVSLFTGMCYVEFASRMPRAGSSYTYTYCILGELPAFIVGWTMLLDYILSMASVAKAFSGTVDSLSRRQVSGFFAAKLGKLPAFWSAFDDTWDLVAVGLILVIALLVLGGARFSLSVNAGLSCLQLLCLIAITGAAFGYGRRENWTGTSGGFFPYGAPGVLEGASIAMFAFAGFESLGTAAEECRDPKRDLPRALLGSFITVSILYIAATLGLSYLQPYYQLDTSAPFVTAFAGISGARWAEVTAAVGTLLATGATKVSSLYVVPRVMYALAADGIIFSAFASVNQRVRVPLLGLAFGALVSSALALVFRMKFLAEMVGTGTLVSYLVVGVDLFVLRYLHFAGAADSAVPMRSWAEGLVRRCLPQLARVRALRWLFVAYVAACFLLGGALQLANFIRAFWTWGFIAAAAVPMAALFVVLCAYRPHDVPGGYHSPAMPVAPLLTVLVNAVMLVRLSPLTWLSFFSWLKTGLSVYTVYGMGYSKVDDNKRPASSETKPDLDNGGSELRQVEEGIPELTAPDGKLT